MVAQLASHFKELDSCRMVLSRADDLVEGTQISQTVNDVNKPSRKREIISSLKQQNPQVSLSLPANKLA
jgi:hypothetical protein